MHAPLLGMRWVFIPPGKYRTSNNPFPAHSTPAVGKPRTAAAPQKLALPVSAWLHAPQYGMGRVFIPLGRCRTSNNPFQAHSTPAVGKPRTAAVPQKLALPVSAWLHAPQYGMGRVFIPLGRCRTSNNPFQAHSTGWDGPGPGRGPPPGAAPPGRPWRRFGASSGTGRPS